MKRSYRGWMIPVSGRMSELAAGMKGFLVGVLFTIAVILVWRYVLA